MKGGLNSGNKRMKETIIPPFTRTRVIINKPYKKNLRLSKYLGIKMFRFR
jgi:hypothetical protein